MMTYKKLSQINYDCFVSVCIYLNDLVRELTENKDKYPEYHDPYRLKKAKNALKTAIQYLKGNDYYMLDYCTNSNVAYYDYFDLYQNFLADRGFFDL